MRIAIVGTGAMGTVLGAFLTKNGCPVDMVDSYKDHVDAMKKDGAHIIGTVDMVVPVSAMLPEEMTGIYDLIFLFTKQTANATVLPALLQHLDENSTVCTLQNGVPEPSVASYVGQNRTVGGTVLWGATFISPGVSQLTSNLEQAPVLFDVGEMDGTVGPRIQKVAEVLGIMGTTVVTDKLMESRWVKLINNACVSGMSAACGITFGEVVETPETGACVAYIGNEVKKCCEAAGYTMTKLAGGFPAETLNLKDQAQYDQNQQDFIDMYVSLRPAKASMLQDLEKGKQTEVLMINGFVCDTGKQYGIPTPFNDAVVEVVTAIERGEKTPCMDNLDRFRQIGYKYKFYNA